MAKCFVVYSENIEGRFDPLYLKNISVIQNIKAKFPLVSLGKLLKAPVQYGANEIAIDGDPKRDTRYIRITDIDEFGNLKDDDWQTAKYVDDKYLLEEDDILFARSGATAGKTFIYKNEFGKAIFAGYLIRFKIDKTKANPNFVFFCTQLARYNLWVKSIQRPSGQPNINSEEFKSFEIPLPPLEIQNRFVEIMEHSYRKKEQKETEAQKLLNSINDYLLAELEIELPKISDRKCFFSDSDEINKTRLDPYYYQPKFIEVDKAIKKGKYKQLALREISSEILSGQRPKGGVRQILEGIPSLGGEHVFSDGSIALQGLRFIPLKFHKEHLKSKLNKLDILLVKDGATTGKVGIVPEGYPFEEANINEHVFLIRCGRDTDPYYLFAFLKSTMGQEQLNREITGGTIMGIIRESVEKTIIPTPPISVQNKIADEVKKRMQKVEQLHQEAKELIENAKAEVDNILLK